MGTERARSEQDRQTRDWHEDKTVNDIMHRVVDVIEEQVDPMTVDDEQYEEFLKCLLGYVKGKIGVIQEERGLPAEQRGSR